MADFAEELSRYRVEYPGQDIGALLACHSMCTKRIATTLAEAHNHIWGAGSERGCKWCQLWLKEHQELERRAAHAKPSWSF